MRALLILVLLFAARPARAQCGAHQAQCRTCHQLATGGAPLCNPNRPWHRDHAFAPFCSDCHGGDPDATEIGRAHAGLAWPLIDEGARCETCHAGRGRALVRPYLATVDRARAERRAPSPAGNAILAGVALLLAAGGAAFVVHNERRR